MSDKSPKIYYSSAGEETDTENLRRQKNNRTIRNMIFGVFLLILGMALALGWNQQSMDKTPLPTGEASGDIDTSNNPVQTSTTAEPIKRTVSGDEFTIEPVAGYEISGLIESNKHFSSSEGFEGDKIYAEISPVDLCISWGKLAEEEYNKYVDFRPGKVGSARACYFQAKSGFPFDQNYLISHASNNHVIPATENVHNAINSLKIKDRAILKGFLVNVKRKSNGQEYTFLQSSLIRGDWGLEGCEVFYVKSVRIGNKIYE